MKKSYLLLLILIVPFLFAGCKKELKDKDLEGLKFTYENGSEIIVWSFKENNVLEANSSGSKSEGTYSVGEDYTVKLTQNGVSVNCKVGEKLENITCEVQGLEIEFKRWYVDNITLLCYIEIEKDHSIVAC